MSIDSPILILGSCFSTEISRYIQAQGGDILINPFGVQFNPASIANSVRLLSDTGFLFTENDVIERDPFYRSENNSAEKNSSKDSSHIPIAPCRGGFTSYYHHGSFTRATRQTFLSDANESLIKARNFYTKTETVIVTFGTSWVFRHRDKGIIVSNCHKHRADEFHRERLSVNQIVTIWEPILNHSDKKWIFTVSPIRHLKDGLHGNQISKSTLLLACDELCSALPSKAFYFPSYEIMMDELRDYSWYADDKVHPSEEAVDFIAKRFMTCDITFPESFGALSSQEP